MSDPICLSCGACCLEAVVPPFSSREILLLDAELAGPILEVWAHAADPSKGFWDQTGSRVCSWFNITTGECDHYEHRPEECRSFRVASEACVAMREKSGIAERVVPITISASSRR